jgi:NADH:ubiquinone oxidoreductase subunit F (NADH-binding)/NADH:ubiquinone oxidoreductase subunit E
MATGSPFAHLPRERTWLLPALDAVQRTEGSVSAERLAGIAAHLRVPLSEVWGVATHYPEVRLTAPGRRLVRVCTGVSCRVRGGLRLLRECERRLGIKAGATTPDGEVTLEELDCTFACGVAPLIEVQHRRLGRVRVEDLERCLTGQTEDLHQGLASQMGNGQRDRTVSIENLDRVAGDAGSRPGRQATRSHASDEPASSVIASASSPADRFAALRQHAQSRGEHSAGTRLVVGVGSCGLAVGAGETLEALRTETRRRGLPLTVVAGGCSGACWAAPAVAVVRDGAPVVLTGPVTVADVARFAETLAGNGSLAELAVDPGWLASQHRVLLARAGVVDPGDITDAIRRGAYHALADALDGAKPERVIAEVRAAGLQGRGGAYFQTAMKWEACRAASGEPKFVVVNAEEGEPGIFKDRHLMESDPHLILEGALLAAFAVGASRGILYIHGEADLGAARLANALDQARAWGLVGRRILGSDFSFDVEIRRGLGGFVLGEETALLESIEGRRAMPRTRPPFPVESGLWGKPTVINNVETLAAVPAIVERGGAWFGALGRGHGTKLFGLSGHLCRPGVVEMEVGGTLRELIDGVGGGMADGHRLHAVVVGGPSGSVVSARKVDEALVPRGSVSPGTGGVIALDEEASVRDVVQTLLAFNARESCGKCTPCREGTARLLAMLEGPLDGSKAKALAEVIQLASLCGLGQAAPYAVLSGLAEFPDEFLRVS